jgi:hypothetical protein
MSSTFEQFKRLMAERNTHHACEAGCSGSPVDTAEKIVGSLTAAPLWSANLEAMPAPSLPTAKTQLASGGIGGPPEPLMTI